MKTMLLKISLLAVLGTSLMACSRGSIDSNFLANDVNGNNNIYRSYRLAYDEDKGSALAMATLSVGSSYGSTVRLVSPAGLTVNGSPAKESTDVVDGGEIAAFYAGFIFPPAWLLMGTSGTNYSQAIRGHYADFEFTDMNGKKFQDSINVPQIYLTTQDAFFDGVSFKIIGTAATRLSVTVSLAQGTVRETVTSSSAQVEIPAYKLSGFAPGPIDVKVTVEQTQSISADAQSLGGELTMSYSFRSRKINVR